MLLLSDRQEAFVLAVREWGFDWDLTVTPRELTGDSGVEWSNADTALKYMLFTMGWEAREFTL